MKKQFVVLAVLLCLFVAAGEMQGLPQDPGVTTVYVSGPATNEIVATTWGPSCTGPVVSGAIASAGSQFRPTGIEVGADGYIYFADDSHSEVGRVDLNGVPGDNIEIIFSSSTSTLENPTDVIFAGSDLIVSSRAGSRKSKAGLFKISRDVDGSFLAPEPLVSFGSGGGSSAESLGILFDRSIVATESSDDQVLTFAFPYDSDPSGPSGFLTDDQPLGIAAIGVGDDIVIYVGFPRLGQVWTYSRTGTGGEEFETLIDGYKPRHLEVDLAGNVYVAASKRSNGRDGRLYCIPPGGAYRWVPLDSAWGVSVAAGGEVTRKAKFSSGGKAFNLCGDAIFIETSDGSTVEVNLTCQDLTPQEFKDQVAPTFPDAQCLPEPGKKSCTMISVDAPIGALPGLTQFLRTLVTFEDFHPGGDKIWGNDDDTVPHPGILYRKPSITPLFTKNILTRLELVIFSDFDPGRLTGSRDNFGSDLVFCSNCNADPEVDAGLPQTVVQGETVNLSGTVFDFAEVIDFDSVPHSVLQVDWTWESGPGPAPVIVADPHVIETGVTAAAVDGLAAGVHTFRLTAKDSAGSTVFHEVEIAVADAVPPVIESLEADPDTLWPPNHEFVDVTLTIDAYDPAGDDIVCAVTKITHDQVTTSIGDGDTDLDWDFTSPGLNVYSFDEDTEKWTLDVKIMSERAESSFGRKYTITLMCTDSFDNPSDFVDVNVFVMDNQGGK